jgi:hypothetical protein
MFIFESLSISVIANKAAVPTYPCQDPPTFYYGLQKERHRASLPNWMKYHHL